MPEDRLTIGRSGQTVRDVIVDLRDDELRFSQALKDRLTGSTMIDVFKDEEGVAKAEIPSADDTTSRSSPSSARRGNRPWPCCKDCRRRHWDDGSQGPLTIRAASDALLRQRPRAHGKDRQPARLAHGVTG